MELQLFFCLFSFVVNFYLFGYVLLRNPFPKVNRAFVLVSMFCTLWNFSILMSFPDQINGWHYLIYISATWLGVAGFYFMRQVSYPGKYSEILGLLGISAVFLSIIVYQVDFSDYQNGSTEHFILAFSIHLLISMASGLFLIYKRRSESNNPLTKRVYTYLISASYIAFLGGLVNNLTDGYSPYDIGVLSNGLYTLIIGYVIVKTRLLELPRQNSLLLASLGWILFMSLLSFLLFALELTLLPALLGLFFTGLVSTYFTFSPWLSDFRETVASHFFLQPAMQKRILEQFAFSSMNYIDTDVLNQDYFADIEKGASAEVLGFYRMNKGEKIKSIIHEMINLPPVIVLPEGTEFENILENSNYLTRESLTTGEPAEWKTYTLEFFETYHIQLALKVRGSKNVIYFIFLKLTSEMTEWAIQDINFMITLTNQYILIREHLEAVKEKQKMERMATIGQMTVTLAHEIRNPLSSIKFAAKSITNQNQEKYRNIIIEEADRLNRLVTDLLDYGKPIKLNPENISIRNLAESVKERVLLIPEYVNAQVITDFQSDWIKNTDKELFSQVLLNLILNALQAGNSQTKVFIREVDEHTLVIEDNGPGVPKENIGQLFTPFFTTKSEGNGLGLSIVRRILDSMDASIYYDRNYTSGARFVISFI